MKLKFIGLGFILFLTVTAQAQRRHRAPNPNDTISSNYNPATLFSPMFYTDKGNEVHAPTGEPGPKYWQNRVDYQIKAGIDTVSKTLTSTENINYTNNSPYQLQYLWLQLDQNTYKKDARSNFATANARAPNDHTTGYQFESVEIMQNGKILKANYIINDTRMQIRLQNELAPNGGKITILIKYHYNIPGVFGGRTDYNQTKNGKIYEIAQWFPRMCVFDDSHGWDTLPFLGTGEFYLEYGDIDYSVTVPWDMLVAGAGELQNPAEVLTTKQISRLATARNSDKTVMIRSADEHRARYIQVRLPGILKCITPAMWPLALQTPIYGMPRA
jgi:hypothetical protein